MKKAGKTTRPFRYDLNQIPYDYTVQFSSVAQSYPTLCDPMNHSTPDYTVEVTNRFKGLDLIECLKNYEQRFMTLFRRQGSRPFPIKEMQKGKITI